jgi:cell division protein ZapA (FtsZ GTPase activity inhibitor)
LPQSVQKPTPEQWKSITNDILKELAKKLGIEVNDFKGKIFANVHEQDNPHLNLVVSRIINGRSLKALDQKGTIGVVKAAFTASTLARCGLDVSAYKPLQTNLGPRQEKWQIQQKEAEKALKKVGLEAEKLNLEVARAKGLAKYSAMLNNQILKWIEAVNITDEKQEKRQENRIEQTIDKLTGLNLPEEQIELLNQLFEQAEQKTGKPVKNRVRCKI